VENSELAMHLKSNALFTPSIVTARSPEAIERVRTLMREYADERQTINLCVGNFEDELVNLPGDYAPPHGELLLASVGEVPAGCVGLIRSSQDTCEMKRLYVRERFRGAKIGLRLVKAITAKAVRIGYRSLKLATHPSMQTAIALYRSLGFYEIEPFYPDPAEGIRFMELDLTNLPENAEIRNATLEHSDAIAHVLREAFSPYQAEYTAAAFAATTPSREEVGARLYEGPIWVAIRNGQIVGTVSVVGRQDELYLRSLAVIRDSQGLGVGRRLMDLVESYARSKNVKRMVLSTTPFLHSAIGLYEKMGFCRTKDGPFDLHGTALFTMGKIIK
jgi:ribosomal protein S18 acetylase RimI-like enzyme